MTDAMRSITIEIPTPVAHKLNETFEGTLEDATRAGLKLINGMGPAAYATLNALAAQLETTPAKVLRAAIEKMADYAATMNMTATNVGRPKINTQRDIEVYERLKSGLTQVQVAAEFSLSVVRVGQIAAQQRHLNGDAPRRGQRKPEVLTLKVSPSAPTPSATPTTPDTPLAPRKLAVIPPSMRNPELFSDAKPIKIPDPATVDISMFADDNPDFAL